MLEVAIMVEGQNGVDWDRWQRLQSGDACDADGRLHPHCALCLRFRNPEMGSLRRTLMTRVVFGRTEADVDRKLDGEARDRLPEAIIAGTPDEIVERLCNLSVAGVQRVMLQWLEVDDIDSLEAMAHSVLPQLAAG